MLTFEETLAQMKQGAVFNFKEYTMDRHERKHLAVSIENGIIQRFIPANVPLNRFELEQYYGTDLDDDMYMVLSCMPINRVIVGLGLNESGQTNIKVITLVKDFYRTGLQEWTVEDSFYVDTNEPNYLKSQGWWSFREE